MIIDPLLKKAIEERISAGFTESEIVTELVDNGYKKTDAETYYALVFAKSESPVSSKLEKTEMHIPDRYKRNKLSPGAIVLIIIAIIMVMIAIVLFLVILDIITIPLLEGVSIFDFDWSRLNPQV